MDSVDESTGSTQEGVLEAFSQFDAPCTPLTANEIAERAGCTPVAAHEILERLTERGSLRARSVESGSRVWWVPAGAHREDDGGERAQTDAESFGAFVQSVEEYAIFTLDPEGRIVNWNDGARRIKGYDRDEALGEHISLFYTDDDRERDVPEQNLKRAAERGRFEDEGWRVRKDGSEFWANVVITAIRDDEGTLKGFTKVTRDMTDHRDHERQLRRERDQVEQLLKTSPVAISVEDTEGETVMANQRAQDLLGLSEEEIIGEREDIDEWTVYDTDGTLIDPEEMPAARVRATGEAVFDEVIAIERPGAERMWFSVNAAPVFGPDGELERVVSTGDDITRLKNQARRIERRRDELEHELAEVFDRVTDAFYGLDEQWRFTHVNARAQEILGRTEEEVIGNVLWEACPEMEAIIDRETLRDATENQEALTYEEYFGPRRAWFEVRIYPSETGVSVYFTDVTERKERERELERYRKVIETVDDGVYVVDTDGRFTMVNEAYAELTGYSREELLGSPVSLVVDEETAETARRIEQELLDGQRDTAKYEVDVHTPTGETIRAEATFSLIHDDDGRCDRVGVVRDVSERVARERELEEQRERYRQLVETAPVSIATHDADGTLVYVNDASAELVGAADTDSLLGEPALEFVHPEDRPEAAECVRRVIEERTASQPREARIVGLDGEVRHAILTSVPISHEGDPAAQVVLTDITERKEREQALARYKTVFETVDDGIYVLDTDFRFVEVNDAYAEMTGYSRAELVGSHCSLVVGEDVSARSAERYRELAAGERETATIEADIVTRDGDRVPGESKFTSLGTGDGHSRGSVGVVRDLTERKEYERQLETRVRQQRVVTELGQRALEDPELDVLFAEAVRAVADTLGNDYCGVLELLDDDELLLRSGCGWEDGYVGVATVGTDANSQAGYALLTGGPIVVDDLESEDRFERPDILVDHGMVSGITIVVGSPHDPWGVLGTHDTVDRVFTQHDVNFVQSVATILTTAIERNRYERRLTDTIEQLRVSNERLERFAYIASHDLQEPLRMISNYLRLLEDRYRDAFDEDAEEFIRYAVDGADRMREMIDDLLEYSRVETRANPLEPTDAGAVVDRVLDSLQLQIEETDADVVVDTLPTVVADDKQLEQLFQNLVSNALKYRGDDSPRVEISATERADEWLFQVADNGIGIDQDYTDRIFEVFKRLHTREEYPGTGIGLALCKRIVDRHGGDIWVDSEPGNGSTFSFTLPREGGDT